MAIWKNEVKDTVDTGVYRFGVSFDSGFLIQDSVKLLFDISEDFLETATIIK